MDTDDLPSVDPVPAASPGPGSGGRDRRDDGRPENARPRDWTGRPLPRDTDETRLAVVVEPDSVEQALQIAVSRWSQRRFFEAHEVLEFVWHWSLQDWEKDFWQGVIQLAAAQVHDQRGNPLGVVRSIDKALPKLTDVPPDHHGIDVAGLREWARVTAAALEADETADVSHVALADDPSAIHLDPDRADTPIERRGHTHSGTLDDAAGS